MNPDILVYVEKIDQLKAEIERLSAAHQDIVRKYEQVMKDPPEWTDFKGDQLTWVREAWYGAAQISRRALAIEQSVSEEGK